MYLPMPTPGWVAFADDSEPGSRIDADEALLEFISLHNRNVRKEPTVGDFAKKYGRLGVPAEHTRSFTVPAGFEIWGLPEMEQSALAGSRVVMEDEQWWHAAISTFANISDLSYIASLGIAAQNLPTFRRAATNNFLFRDEQDGPELVYHADTGLSAPFPGSEAVLGEGLAEVLDYPFAMAKPLLSMPDSDSARRKAVAESADELAAAFARFCLLSSDGGPSTLVASMKAALAKRVEERNGFGACLYCGRAFDLTDAKKKTRKFLCDQRCATAFNRQVASIYKELFDIYGYTVNDLKSVGLGRSEEELEELLRRD